MAQFGLPAASFSLDGKCSQPADWKPLPEGKPVHFFVSHTGKKHGADGHAALVTEKLEPLGYGCWIDTEHTADPEGMEAGVRGSVCLLIFLFKGAGRLASAPTALGSWPGHCQWSESGQVRYMPGPNPRP
jgi:hypothetical protein